MEEELEMIFDMAKEQMEASMDHLKRELLKIRTGRANPVMLSSVMVEYYGSKTPLSQVSNVTTPDAHTLMIQPFEKSLLQEIEKSIINSNLGLNPQNNGEMVIINVPMLTEDRRRDLAKQAKAEGEHAKVSVRNARHDAMHEVKKLKDNHLSEDAARDAEDEIQKDTNSYSKKVDDLVAEKEAEIMKV
ncbi:ribosome recycling factor [bacterium SCSIO 12643]|nr:ribosome recycling factor [bacterium SCSIO 12643]